MSGRSGEQLGDDGLTGLGGLGGEREEIVDSVSECVVSGGPIGCHQGNEGIGTSPGAEAVASSMSTGPAVEAFAPR